MGWGTTFSPEIYLSKVTFDNSWEIENYISEKELYIKDAKNRLCMYASATPKDICPDDWKDEIVTFLSNEVSTHIDYLEDLIIEKTKAELLLSYVIDNNIDVKTLKT
jgi:hypothetical protein